MASTQNQLAHVDLFDAYLRRADLDRDRRISSYKAVAFFQGSGHPNRSLRRLSTTATDAWSWCLAHGTPAGGRPPKTVAPSHAEEKQQAN